MGAPRDDNDEQAELRRGVLWEEGKAEDEDRNGSSRMRGCCTCEELENRAGDYEFRLLAVKKVEEEAIMEEGEEIE